MKRDLFIPHSFISSFIVAVVFLVSACGQPQKKPFSNPRLYADPPPAASPVQPVGVRAHSGRAGAGRRFRLDPEC